MIENKTMNTLHYHEITSVDALREMLATHERIERCVFQDMDFSEVTEESHTARYFDCLFMGCTFSKPMRIQIDKSCLIFSHIGVPYNCFRNVIVVQYKVRFDYCNIFSVTRRRRTRMNCEIPLCVALYECIPFIFYTVNGISRP